jgi:hypothetical protein
LPRGSRGGADFFLKGEDFAGGEEDPGGKEAAIREQALFNYQS